MPLLGNNSVCYLELLKYLFYISTLLIINIRIVYIYVISSKHSRISIIYLFYMLLWIASSYFTDSVCKEYRYIFDRGGIVSSETIWKIFVIVQVIKHKY